MAGGTSKSLRTISIFVLAGRGMWTLGLFIFANGKEIDSYIKTYRSRSLGSVSEVPEAELETVQLNVALQLEIVRFTVKGIKKAVSDNDQIGDSNIDRASGSFKLSTTKLSRLSMGKEKIVVILVYYIYNHILICLTFSFHL